MAVKDDIDRHIDQLGSAWPGWQPDPKKPAATLEQIPGSHSPHKIPRKTTPHPKVTISPVLHANEHRRTLQTGNYRTYGKKHISPSDSSLQHSKQIPTACFWVSRPGFKMKFILIAIKGIEINGAPLLPKERMDLQPGSPCRGRVFSRDKTRSREFEIKVELPREGSS